METVAPLIHPCQSTVGFLIQVSVLFRLSLSDSNLQAISRNLRTSDQYFWIGDHKFTHRFFFLVGKYLNDNKLQLFRIIVITSNLTQRLYRHILCTLLKSIFLPWEDHSKNEGRRWTEPNDLLSDDPGSSVFHLSIQSFPYQGIFIPQSRLAWGKGFREGLPGFYPLLRPKDYFSCLILSWTNCRAKFYIR